MANGREADLAHDTQGLFQERDAQVWKMFESPDFNEALLHRFRFFNRRAVECRKSYFLTGSQSGLAE